LSARPGERILAAQEDDHVHAASSHRAGLSSRPVAGVAAGAVRASRARQDWPSKPVTIVVPYGPGASNDTFTRALAAGLTKQFGQTFVVVNRPGAGGFIGSHAVAKAAPDGYTLLEMPSSIAGFKPIMKVDLDPLKDLAPIALAGARPRRDGRSTRAAGEDVKEFIDYARARPDEISTAWRASAPAATSTPRCSTRRPGLKLRGVNYKSAADSMTDIIGGPRAHDVRDDREPPGRPSRPAQLRCSRTPTATIRPSR
jgi:tripartite-type tricarboxylate transporter receptor subunit TctC